MLCVIAPQIVTDIGVEAFAAESLQPCELL